MEDFNSNDDTLFEDFMQNSSAFYTSENEYEYVRLVQSGYTPRILRKNTSLQAKCIHALVNKCWKSDSEEEKLRRYLPRKLYNVIAFCNEQHRDLNGGRRH